jgi:hypothetical protein
VGLCLFLVGLWANVVRYPIKNLFLPVALLLGTLLLSIAVDQYYKHTFGELKPILASRRLYWITQCLWGLLGIVAFWVDVTFNLSISLIGLLFAAMFLVDKPRVTFPLNKFSIVRLVSSICIIFVSIAPLYFGKSWWDLLGVRTTIIGVTMFVGALIALQGLIWHIFFVNSLPTLEATDE